MYYAQPFVLFKNENRTISEKFNPNIYREMSQVIKYFMAVSQFFSFRLPLRMHVANEILHQQYMHSLL